MPSFTPPPSPRPQLQLYLHSHLAYLPLRSKSRNGLPFLNPSLIFFSWLTSLLTSAAPTHAWVISSKTHNIIAVLFTFPPSNWNYQVIFILQTVLPAPSHIPQPPVLKSKHFLGRIFFPLQECLFLLFKSHVTGFSVWTQSMHFSCFSAQWWSLNCQVCSFIHLT